jgi:hypothetical protein
VYIESQFNRSEEVDIMYQVGDAVDTTEGPAIVQRIHPDGDLELTFPEDPSPDEKFTMAPVDVSPCTKRRWFSRRPKSIMDVPRSTNRQCVSSQTKSKTLADVPRSTNRQCSSHNVVPETTQRRRSSRNRSTTVVDVPETIKRRRSSRNRSTTVVDVPGTTKRRRSSNKKLKIVVDVPRPTKRQRSSDQKEEHLPEKQQQEHPHTKNEVPRTTMSMYKKDRNQTLSKTEQNTAFLVYLRSLGIPMKKLSVLVLDTSVLRTTRMLLAAGLMPSHIYIPQPDVVEATLMLDQYPTLRVFVGLKAGDLIWKMADRGVRFHGALMDYCGMPGKIGRKNTPVDDMASLLRYNLLADQAVLTQTVCARSCVQVTEKFESFKYLVRIIRNCSRHDGRRLYKAKELIYTDPGSQTMCHFRCILSR